MKHARTAFIVFLACFVALSAASAAESENHPYWLRLVHENWNGTACVLLQKDGGFHYENGYHSSTKVYEGTLPSNQILAVRRHLQRLADISQSQIEEPLIRRSRDRILVSLYESGEWHELLFQSQESQEPYRESLKPLVQWMDDLYKLPHHELSEDAGKRNCLPARKMVLLNRDEIAQDDTRLQPSSGGVPAAGQPAAPNAGSAQAASVVAPLLQFSILTRSSDGAHQACALVVDDGRYRFEDRRQKSNSKNVETVIAEGQISAEELARLREILNASALASLRHHKPPGGMELRIMGSVAELSIDRKAGVQDLILTDATHRNTWFYAGDGDISLAEPLLQFLHEHLESRASPSLRASERNGCTSVP